jgi:hypothetical protein
MFRWDERIDALEAVYARVINARSREAARFDLREPYRERG